MAEGETVSAFTPSEQQRSLLKVFQDAGYRITIAEACDGVAGLEGDHRRQYYRWMDKPEFAAWWQAEAERFFTLKLPSVHANLHRMATTPVEKGRLGDAKAAELLLQRFDKGFVPRSQKDINAVHDVSISPHSIDEALERWADKAAGASDGD